MRVRMLSAYEHQSYPFDRLVEELKVDRDMSRSPVFDVMVIYQKAVGVIPSVEGITIGSRDTKAGVSKYDLTFNIREYDSKVLIDLEYSTDLFDHWRIVGMGHHLEELLKSTQASIDQRVGLLRYLSQEEESGIYKYCVGRVVRSVFETRVENVFRHRVIESPDGVAAVCGEVHLTYRKLDEVSDAVAGYLEGFGVKEETLVSVVSDRSVELLAMLLGIMKSGCVYVPLDPSYPLERMKLMLKNCGAGLLLAGGGMRDRLPLEDLKGEGLVDRIIDIEEMIGRKRGNV